MNPQMYREMRLQEGDVPPGGYTPTWCEVARCWGIAPAGEPCSHRWHPGTYEKALLVIRGWETPYEERRRLLGEYEKLRPLSWEERQKYPFLEMLRTWHYWETWDYQYLPVSTIARDPVLSSLVEEEEQERIWFLFGRPVPIEVAKQLEVRHDEEK